MIHAGCFRLQVNASLIPFIISAEPNTGGKAMFMKKPMHFIASLMAGLILSVNVSAQPDRSRAVLVEAAEALGGLEVLQGLDNFVLTGFGQRYSTNGNLSPDPNAPPKWQSVTDARRYFDLGKNRALNQERNSFQYPLAASFGHTWALNNTVQERADMLDHPVTAVLAALDSGSSLGPVTTEDGYTVVQFSLAGGTPFWLALDPITHRPYWVRRITGDHTLGDVSQTTYFTGYVPYEGVEMPLGIMTRIDWRDQVTYMLQVDSYRVNVPDLPEMPLPARDNGPEDAAIEVEVTALSDGVWDVRIPGNGRGGDGGAVIEFADHLVMFEPYGDGPLTLARIDAANELVPGKQVTAIITTLHHGDHAGGVRAAVSRGITIIGERETGAFYEEWVNRSAINFPDALARDPQALQFMPVDDVLVLEDELRRLEIYQVVGHAHMGNAVFAYLPEERFLMEGDLGDVNWEWHWWAGALQANMDYYNLDPVLNIPVHGEPLPINETLSYHQQQAEAAMGVCRNNQATGMPFFGCPVKYDAEGAVPIAQ